ncbi:DUF6580 family putative transport protein [Leptospira wolffii]|uniref:DUF6580 family putative transport protein n=1 Tax=Leptospira wolffii TaxID=409998 RepID=A0A2M9ZHH2_9LEPT|nr:DUF6580 family putative transport protein [Leptospira wolffii]PJZ67880.1 hypothetical protein CH371_03295 [Leptospira wolffii]TGK62090.1 hypothetical protein EHQ32_04430 [Leptospira wolffii]TGK68692.1 hypothetical protein EHQ27_13875 [Leptospira wolffii]TGK74524.1 hypothetical protein EHQ35_09345 [Leptospira wolffii]TGL31900.1 hypothetical protein EHQ57_03330 [Leptospira wolffii]
MALSRNLVAFVLLSVAVISRFLPHLPNFTPVLAISLFAGVYFSNRWLALGLPMGIMFLSDLWIGLHDLMPVVYGLFLLFAVVGMYLKERLNPISLGLAGFLGSVTFFIVTNFFVWLTSGMYTLDGNGFVACYVAALPFFKYALLGDAVYIPALFGTFYLLERSGFVTSPQAA